MGRSVSHRRSEATAAIRSRTGWGTRRVTRTVCWFMATSVYHSGGRSDPQGHSASDQLSVVGYRLLVVPDHVPDYAIVALGGLATTTQVRGDPPRRLRSRRYATGGPAPETIL